MLQKVVLNVKLSGNKKKIKAMKAVAELDGVYTLSVHMIDQQLTAIGDIEAAQVVKKLKKICDPVIIHFVDSQAREEEDEAPKRDDNKTHKVVLNVELRDKAKKEKAMKAVAEFDGLASMTVDKNRGKLTVIGDINASKVEKKLDKICGAKIVSVAPLGPAEEKRSDVTDDFAALARATTTVFGLGKNILLRVMSLTSK
ncbi:hypothetical protein L6164_005980 [Bauhinia variegata]|uniref:Uncharacterized protein n=1 Tax=Bauhinia variegata TaxID=167791 RepID=A0ACB9PSV0_BAUVA|nr:hypothetical protein L6164_005980 [Bauhinia variegata]